MNEIPLVDLRANGDPIDSEILCAIQQVLKRGAFILGSEVADFEREFAAHCDVDHAVGVDSGTSALELALRAFGVGPGDEVITAANTFIATVFAVRYTGARPVLVDVMPETYTLDPEAVELAITSRTKAVIPVHLYGHPADMASIGDVARRHRLIVIEDACQAHGARYDMRPVGSLGDAGAFSFYPSKNLGALGDGGMVVTSDPALAARLRALRDYGQVAKSRHAVLGYNRRLDELHAAVLRLKLKRLDAWNNQRQRAAGWYAEALRGLDIVLPRVDGRAVHVFHLYVVRAQVRDALRAHLEAHKIRTGVHYPVPIHLQDACADLGYCRGDFPVTEALAETILSLPMFPGLTQDQVRRVGDEVARFFARTG